MSKIYLVSSGSYSDYSIHSVWSTREKADAEVERINRSRQYDKAEVEEFWLDGPAVDDLGLGVWCVNFREGAVTVQREEGRVAQGRGRIFVGDPGKYAASGDGQVYVHALDEGHAIKIAADLRAEAMARPRMPGTIWEDV